MNWNSNWNADKDQVSQLDVPIPQDILQRLKKEKLPPTADGILMLWQKTKDALASAKADEMDIRKLAVKIYVPNPQEGMNNVDLGNGFTLKAGVKFNYNLDKDNKKISAVLDEIAAIGNEGPFIAERLISWTPNFLLTEYRKLQDEADNGNNNAKVILKIIGKVLTITDAAPTLEVKEPKKK